MSVISLFSGAFCKDQPVVAAIQAATRLPVVADADLVQAAGALSGLGSDKIARAFSAKTSLLGRFTNEKQRAAAWLRLALATRLVEDESLLLTGFCALLPPGDIAHVLRACLIANAASRWQTAADEAGLAEREARKSLERDDEDRAFWAGFAAGAKDPWDPALYDIVVPMDKTSVAAAAALVVRHAADPAVRPTDASRAAARDFLLAARVETVVAGKGHDVAVSARDGMVILTINRKALLLERLENELRTIAAAIEGVRDVATRVGKGFYQTDIYRRAHFEMLPKSLLVEEEREFVQTLSERLRPAEAGRPANPPENQ